MKILGKFGMANDKYIFEMYGLHSLPCVPGNCRYAYLYCNVPRTISVWLH